jgi:hypothetical protein
MSCYRTASTIAGCLVLPLAAAAQSAAPACYATRLSMTPASWRAPSRATQTAPKPGLTLVREIALPGPANRFDYQSVDPAAGRIYINHMNAGRTIVFDADSAKVMGEVMDLPRATGVWAVPSHHHVYVSAAGAHEVAIIDDRTLKVVSRVGGIRFPDGIAYAPEADKVFVSDESGDADVVIDPKTAAKALDDRARRRSREHALRLGVALHSGRRADEESARGDRPGERTDRAAL